MLSPKQSISHSFQVGIIFLINDGVCLMGRRGKKASSHVHVSLLYPEDGPKSMSHEGMIPVSLP